MGTRTRLLKRVVPGITLAAVTVAAALAASATAAAERDRGILGLPSGESILFASVSDTGSLTRQQGSKRLRLVLRDFDREAVWFSDRPDRDSGTVPIRGVVRNWARLGFADDPPNAVLSLADGRPSLDTVVVELGKPRISRGALRISVKPVDDPSSGLSQFIDRLDRRVPRRFGESTLFIDNGTTGSQPCNVGEIDYYAMFRPGRRFNNLLSADGSQASISQFLELFEVIGTTFGPRTEESFTVPDLDQLENTLDGPIFPMICAQGTLQTSSDRTPVNCLTGNVQLTALTEFVPPGWVRADGTSLRIADFPVLFGTIGNAFGGDGQSTFSVPKLDAPVGLVNLICADGLVWNPDDGPPLQCTMSSVDLFATAAGNVPSGEFPAEGRLVPINSNQALFFLIGTAFGGTGVQNFGLPEIAPPVPGSSWSICGQGTYPSIES